jgi:hypothetical protein
VGISTATLTALLDKISCLFVDQESGWGESVGQYGPDVASQQNSEAESASSSDETSNSDGATINALMTKLLRPIGLRTRLLMKLLPLIKQTVEVTERGYRPDKFQKAESFQMENAAGYWYLQILDRFNSIDKVLAQRLGQANYQRFKDLRRPRTAAESEQEPRNSIFRPPATVHDSGIGTSILRPVVESGRDAPSVASGSSFASNEEESTSRRVPKTPAAVLLGEPFECRICGQKILLRSRTQWK